MPTMREEWAQFGGGSPGACGQLRDTRKEVGVELTSGAGMLAAAAQAVEARAGPRRGNVPAGRLGQLEGERPWAEIEEGREGESNFLFLFPN